MIAEEGDARRALFARLIDDAGLFPPARKSMPDAVADHRTARAGPAAWMLGRFLCPATRLEELTTHDPGRDWEIACVLGPDPEEWPAAVRSELERVRGYGGAGAVRAIELPLPPGPAAARSVPEAVAALEETMEPGGGGEPVALFLEVPGEVREESDLFAVLEAIGEARAGAGPSPCCLPAAKLRCGGPTADRFPSDRRVSSFISACRGLGLPFKLTAGLHHPFRTPDPETGALQHGFVNLLAATALVDTGDPPGPPKLEPIVAEQRPETFEIDAGGIAWRGSRVDAHALAAARRLFTSFGSCSFSEPLEDLTAHGLLPASRSAVGADD